MKKRPTTMNLNLEADRLLNKLAELYQVSRTRVVEDLILKEAVKLKIAD